MLTVTVSVRAQEVVGGLRCDEIRDVQNSLPDSICVFDPAQYFAATPLIKAALGSPIKVASKDLDFKNVKRNFTDKADYLQIPYMPMACRSGQL